MPISPIGNPKLSTLSQNIIVITVRGEFFGSVLRMPAKALGHHTLRVATLKHPYCTEALFTGQARHVYSV